MRNFASKCPVAFTALSLALAAALLPASAAQAASGQDSLVFDADNASATSGSVSVNGTSVSYTAYTVSYAARPIDADKEIMTIYVPAGATQKAAIYMPLNTGGYNQLDLLTPADVSATSNTNQSQAAALALGKGMVVASVQGRGRNTTMSIDGVTTEVGNGPSAIVDLKAAIRYLRHNDKRIAGDAEKIIISGTSGGGAFSSLIGSTGDSPAYRQDLARIGAADESDAVFAVAPYCPITDIDNANEAYEYFFNGTGLTTANANPVVTLSANDQALSTVLARMYPNYINGLNLKHPTTGAALKLNSYSPDAVMGGTYRNYAYSVFESSATTYIKEQGYLNADGSLNSAGQSFMSTAATVNGVASGLAPKDFLSWSSKTRSATLTSWKNLLTYMNRYKPVGAFDNGFYNVTGEMDVFNTDPTVTTNSISTAEGWNHFDMNLGSAIDKAGLKGVTGYTSLKQFKVRDDVARWAAMLNPLYFITKPAGNGLVANPYAAQMYGSSTVAKHWRIRVGSYDRDSSPFISLNLATALENRGSSVDYAIAWNQPHSGNYDNTQLLAWMVDVSKQK